MKVTREGSGAFIIRLLQVTSAGPPSQSSSSAFSSNMNPIESPSHAQSSIHGSLEVIVEPPRVVQPGDTFPCPVVINFQQANRGCKSTTRSERETCSRLTIPTVENVQREPEAFEDSRIWAAAYLVPGDAAVTPNIDGPPMADGRASPLTGSLVDTPHAPSANELQEAGIRFFVFRNLAINELGTYHLQICIFAMTFDDSPGTLESARHVQSVLTREITVTRARRGSSVGT